MLSRLLFLALALPAVALLVFSATGGLSNQRAVEADVAGVTANAPTFGPGQPLTITVTAEDDDGNLEINSSLAGSSLTATNCVVLGGGQVAGKCDGSGMANVTGQGTVHVTVSTDSLDADAVDEQLTVTLTLTASCTQPTIVTISGDQPGNAGNDLVTVNCVPPTPTPTPTPTSTPTLVPTSTGTPLPTSTPPPTSTPLGQVLSSSILPPSTGSAGLK